MNELYKPKNNPFHDERYQIDMNAEIKSVDFLGADFDKYISPIALEISHAIDDAVMGAVMSVEATVNKEELRKALEYDRNQFAEGYHAGIEAAQPKWISVKDELPSVGQRVIAYVGNVIYEAFIDCEDKWRRSPTAYELMSTVTHWMPLPEPPKES